MAKDVVLDTRNGVRGYISDWVTAFTEVWQAPHKHLDRLLALLSENVVLRAPTTPPVSRGQADSRRAFERAFLANPKGWLQLARLRTGV